ncbi:trypsin-like serine protease, partial [Aquicoccus sp. SCR17]|nr:trypsin-like serine protease [Carideicomes alvinocaridis]
GVAAGAAGAAAAGSANAAKATEASAGATGGDNGTVPPSHPATPPEGRARGGVPLYAWLPLVILLLLSAGVLGWLLLPGTRIFAEAPPARVVTDAEAVRLAGNVNEALRARIATLETALEGAVCEADGTLLMPEGVTIEGMLPPSPQTPMEAQGRRVTAASQPVLPPDLSRLITGPEGDRTTLQEVIESRTVMVLVRSDKGISAGTGFVAGPGTVVTNFHVVDGALPDGIHVTNRALADTRPAELLKISGPFDESGSDFALLQVRGMELPAFPVLVSDASIRGNKVYAAGYPGDALANDAQFTALRAGDSTAVPTLTVTDGTVNVEQSLKGRISVLEHSAPISRGNSGGPLVDACGRLVGVNTFVHKGALRDLNLAQSAQNLVAFLQNTPAVLSVVSTPCEPEILRPSVRSAANGPDPVPDPDPAPAGAPILPKLVKPQP